MHFPSQKTVRSYEDFVAEARGRPGGVQAKGMSWGTTDNRRVRYELKVAVAGVVEFPMTMIKSGRTLYMRAPKAFGSSAWVRTRLTELPPKSLTPADFLDLVREAKDVKALSVERVGGWSTTHFRAKVPLREVVARSARETRRVFRRLRARKSHVPLHAWIDDKGLLRRMGAYYRERGERILMNVEMRDYGVRVGATPPDPATVIEYGDVPLF